MMVRSNWALYLVATLSLLAIILWATGQKNDSTRVRLNVGVTGWPASQAFVQSLNSNEQLKSKTGWKSYVQSNELQMALESGAVEAAILPLVSAQTLANRGVELSALAVVSVSKGAHAILCPPAKNSVYCDLTGSSVGYDWYAEDIQLLNSALRDNNLTIDDINPLFVAQSQKSATNFLNSAELDLMVVRQPRLAKMLNLGFRSLWSSTTTEPEIVHVLVVKSDMLTLNREHFLELTLNWQHYADQAFFEPISTSSTSEIPSNSKHSNHQPVGSQGIYYPCRIEQNQWLSSQGKLSQLIKEVASQFPAENQKVARTIKVTNLTTSETQQ